VQPIMPPPVADQLMAPVGKPSCALPADASYSGAEIRASIECWRAAWSVAAGKHRALAEAVKLREIKVAEAVKAAVR